MSEPVVIHVRDLIFSSKVVATARAEGVPFTVVRDRAKLLDTPGRCLIIDLNAEGAIDTAAEWKQRQGGQVTGFVSHVAATTIDEARRRGIDQVMTNGAFSARLSEVLRQVGAGTE